MSARMSRGIWALAEPPGSSS
ncbi:hypothetical protein A2U01_0104277, partial [Trifolium medium]|nr:hypothetical protein [Trifolium medium]